MSGRHAVRGRGCIVCSERVSKGVRAVVKHCRSLYSGGLNEGLIRTVEVLEGVVRECVSNHGFINMDRKAKVEEVS